MRFDRVFKISRILDMVSFRQSYMPCLELRIVVSEANKGGRTDFYDFEVIH